jgi:hypothetical protein
LPPSDPLVPAVEAQRRELFDFYLASLLALEGQRSEAGVAMRDVLARDPRNPYYRWVAFGSQ